MKKKYITALSIISTVCLLTLTACGNNNDASVSAMNDTPIETTTVEETTTITEETTTIEETITVEETTIQDTSIADDEITGEDKATSTTETLPFTIDDLDFPEENKGIIQHWIDNYEVGEIDYEDLLIMLDENGVDTDDLIDDYLDKEFGPSTGTGSSTGTPQVSYPDGYDAAAAGLLDEAPEQILDRDWDNEHPELSGIRAQ